MVITLINFKSLGIQEALLSLTNFQTKGKLSFFLLSPSFLIVCVHMSTQHLCGSQRTALGSQLSPSTMWVSGIELRLPGLVARAFYPLGYCVPGIEALIIDYKRYTTRICIIYLDALWH